MYVRGAAAGSDPEEVEMDESRIGFVGLGRMGAAIAGNLLRAGHPMVVWNRTPGKADPLVEAGAARASTPAEVCDPGRVVFTMLSDDQALDEVVGSEGFLARLAPGGVHVSMSTVSPETNRRLAERHANEGSALISAPVFGRPEAAVARKLWICLSGSTPSRDRVLPLTRSIGQGTFELGEDPGAANVAKLCGNFLIAAAMEAMAEAFALSEKSGVSSGRLSEILGSTLFSCPIYQSYGKTIADRRFSPPGFALELGLKDLSLVVASASAAAAPMPLAELIRERLASGMARGRRNLDWSALSLGAREDAGLAP
jgi:3-hydroxyisobutyrate dehydrogenase-like beta-hydroxyacid dehydrogenase